MKQMHLTEAESTVLRSIVAKHWADAELHRMITEEGLGIKGDRPAVLDALFQKVTGIEPPEISEYLVFTEGPIGGREPKDMAEVEVLKTVLEAVSGAERPTGTFPR